MNDTAGAWGRSGLAWLTGAPDGPPDFSRSGVLARAEAVAVGIGERRGVRVEVLADAQMNRREKGNAIPRLLAADVPVAFETRYNAAHNKVLIVDAEGPRCAVLTGSYNFTWSADNRNAENILIVRDHCELARAYRANWLRHRKDATRVTSLPWRE